MQVDTCNQGTQQPDDVNHEQQCPRTCVAEDEVHGRDSMRGTTSDEHIVTGMKAPSVIPFLELPASNDTDLPRL